MPLLVPLGAYADPVETPAPNPAVEPGPAHADAVTTIAAATKNLFRILRIIDLLKSIHAEVHTQGKL